MVGCEEWGPRVLYVEDDLPLRRRVKKWCAPHGLVIAAGSVEESLPVIYSGELIDLLVTDLGLPDGSGAEVMKHLRAERPSVPVLITSGLSEEEVRAAIEPFAARSLRKPFEAGAFERQLCRAAPARWHAAVEHLVVRGGLSRAEARVLRAYARGAGPSEIAEEQGLHPRTVHTYRAEIGRKLGVPLAIVLTWLRRSYPFHLGS